MATLIVALDLSSPSHALRLAQTLRSQVRWFKVGLELFTLAGPNFLKELKALDAKIFLDLKFYDIPHTVERAIHSASALGVDLVTLHCQGGQRMLEAAVCARKQLLALGQHPPLLYGVTVLTSMTAKDLPGISQDPGDFALQLALLASQSGLDGIVCSAHEVQNIKAQVPTLGCLCPGIRPSGTQSQDQRRIATPLAACQNGADWLVVGRPIVKSTDPLESARQILSEMQ
ncbi:MAG: orotidine-5'-phosphate decarboxylase [Desulfovibrio sp.]|nr:orotidine-5'-phosphate decarboxylase [Desulfovibrio sp.]